MYRFVHLVLGVLFRTLFAGKEEYKFVTFMPVFSQLDNHENDHELYYPNSRRLLLNHKQIKLSDHIVCLFMFATPDHILLVQYKIL